MIRRSYEEILYYREQRQYASLTGDRRVRRDALQLEVGDVSQAVCDDRARLAGRDRLRVEGRDVRPVNEEVGEPEHDRQRDAQPVAVAWGGGRTAARHGQSPVDRRPPHRSRPVALAGR